jgi:hypothetical protein
MKRRTAQGRENEKDLGDGSGPAGDNAEAEHAREERNNRKIIA